MSNTEYPSFSDESRLYQLVDQLHKTQTYPGGLEQTSIMLTAESAGIPGQYARDAMFTRLLVSAYWPGRDSETGAEFETISVVPPEEFGLDLAAEAKKCRELILAATVGREAIARVPSEFQRIREQYKRGWGRQRTVNALLAGSALINVPFAVCEVTQASHSATIPDGTRAAFLWHPVILHPEMALEELQDSVRRANASEAL